MMKFIPAKLTGAVARQTLRTQKASPQLLFAAGIVSMGATVVLACRATLKVDEILENAQKDLINVDEVSNGLIADAKYTEKDAQRDKATIYLLTAVRIGKLYSPAIICGAVSIAALTGSHNILTRRNAALSAAYATVDRAFKEYRDRIREELGEDRERELYYDLEKCEIDDPEKSGKKKTVLKSKNGIGEYSPYAKFFSSETSSEFSTTPEYNLLYLRARQRYANQLLQSRGHVFLNEIYDSLGFERTSAGSVVGWLRDGRDGYIDFGVLDGQDQDRFYDFMVGDEGGLWLDFNVDGIIYEKI